MRRPLDAGYELDDDPGRIDLDVVHMFLSRDAYWARGRTREVVADTIRSAWRVLGLYKDGALVGFGRAIGDGHTTAYLADVFVLPEHRGSGLGREVVRELVEHGDPTRIRWLLHTADAHTLYEEFGFERVTGKLMERQRRTG